MIADSDRSAAVLLKEKLDEAQAETQRRVNEALANSDACWRMEQEVIVRQRDEALAQVARREREHEALLETAQKALAHVEAERDEALAEVADLSNKYTASWKCSLDVPENPCFDCIRCLRLRLKGRP
jgi:hypothetical protein